MLRDRMRASGKDVEEDESGDLIVKDENMFVAWKSIVRGLENIQQKNCASVVPL